VLKYIYVGYTSVRLIEENIFKILKVETRHDFPIAEGKKAILISK